MANKWLERANTDVGRDANSSDLVNEPNNRSQLWRPLVHVALLPRSNCIYQSNHQLRFVKCRRSNQTRVASDETYENKIKQKRAGSIRHKSEHGSTSCRTIINDSFVIVLWFWFGLLCVFLSAVASEWLHLFKSLLSFPLNHSVDSDKWRMKYWFNFSSSSSSQTAGRHSPPSVSKNSWNRRLRPFFIFLSFFLSFFLPFFLSFFSSPHFLQWMDVIFVMKRRLAALLCCQWHTQPRDQLCKQSQQY